MPSLETRPTAYNEHFDDIFADVVFICPTGEDALALAKTRHFINADSYHEVRVSDAIDFDRPRFILGLSSHARFRIARLLTARGFTRVYSMRLPRNGAANIAEWVQRHEFPSEFTSAFRRLLPVSKGSMSEAEALARRIAGGDTAALIEAIDLIEPVSINGLTLEAIDAHQ